MRDYSNHIKNEEDLQFIRKSEADYWLEHNEYYDRKKFYI